MKRFLCTASLVLLPLLACAKSLRDPTEPISLSALRHEENSLGLELNSIMIRGTYRVAGVNGTFVQEGENVAGFDVVRINSTQIVVKKDGAVFTLPLVGTIKKE